MADDIVERLRTFWREITKSDGGESPAMAMTREAADLIDRQREEIGRLKEVLEWYGENARLCRLVHSEGDAGRHALNDDGGKRARSALSDTREKE